MKKACLFAAMLALVACQSTKAPEPQTAADAATDLPVPMPPPGTPFPEWLFTDERKERITDSAVNEDGQTFVYDDRFVLTIRDSPSSYVQTSWYYIDCQTYWTATEQALTEGKWLQWVNDPSEATDSEQHEKTIQRICESW